MQQRFVSIWFHHLAIDWFVKHHPHLHNKAFVLRTLSHGRMIITAASPQAEAHGIYSGTVLADARAVLPQLEAIDDLPDLAQSVLKKLATWCIRFTPVSALDLPDGIILEATGCTHLWGGDSKYVSEILRRLKDLGYNTRAAIADTPAAAWAVARFGDETIVPVGGHFTSILPLPPEALRLETETVDKLRKLGLHHIKRFIDMPRTSLRRRFGKHLLSRLDLVLGTEFEMIEAVVPPEPWQERLPCLEPIVTATGIEIALKRLLESLCLRLRGEQKGLRGARLKCYRVDGIVESLEIETSRPSHHVTHLFKLFELKIPTIEPALGIELFILEGLRIEDHFSQQEKMWEIPKGITDDRLSELIDRIGGRIGSNSIQRYLPAEHYWPELAYKQAASLSETSTATWQPLLRRPIRILAFPESIEVTAPIPDYPPMLFRHKGKIHQIVAADGPERIEQEWWFKQGLHRDYYNVEDEKGNRYWIFRLGHYSEDTYQWFLHGFFA